MKNILSILSLLCIVSTVNAQNIIDAIRFSQFQPTGTARTAAVGGAFGSMGGDWGSVIINPAGIGDFYKSEFNFGLGINSISNNTFLTNDPTNAIEIDDTSLNLNHIGLVFANRPKGDWSTSNFALGITHIKNFTEDFSYAGSTIGSITERFEERANGNTPNNLDDFEAGLAYEVGAIFDKQGDLDYETDLFDTLNMVNKRQNLFRSGKMTEFNFAWAGNYDNIFNLGMSVNVPFGSFEETKVYRESDEEDLLPIFTGLEYTENLTTSVVGVNFKIGGVAKIGKIVRIGLAAHSPTWFKLTDSYNNSLSYTFQESANPESYSSDSPDGRFEYNLVTPWKFLISTGALFNVGQIKGFVNADVEFQNFNAIDFDFTKFSSNPEDADYEIEINSEINEQLGNAINARLGAELAYKNYRVRLGFNGEGSPFVIDDNKFTRTTISGGIGFRFDRVYIDFTGYRYSDSEGYLPYVVLTESRNQLVNKEQSAFKALATLGFKF